MWFTASVNLSVRGGETRSLNVDMFHLLLDIETRARTFSSANKSQRKKFHRQAMVHVCFESFPLFPIYPLFIVSFAFLFYFSRYFFFFLFNFSSYIETSTGENFISEVEKHERQMSRRIWLRRGHPIWNTNGRNAERENTTRYTFADFVVAANYLHKQISTEANSTRRECFAVPTMQSRLVQQSSPLTRCADPSSAYVILLVVSRHIMISGLLR